MAKVDGSLVIGKLLRSSITPRFLMPPKRLARRRSTSASPASGDESRSASAVRLNFAPKPCWCCGREISPRAKWARNWDSIKFCSGQCKASSNVVALPCNAAVSERNHYAIGMPTSTLLSRCLDVHEPSEGQGGSRTTYFYLDAWLEISILKTAYERSPKSKRDPFPTLADVATALHGDIAQMGEDVTAVPTESSHIDTPPQIERIESSSSSALAATITACLEQTKPGEREMLRRAARRLVVFPRAMWHCTRRFTEGQVAAPDNTKQSHLQEWLHWGVRLTQRQGKVRLDDLHAVSHAKGDIEIQEASRDSGHQ